LKPREPQATGFCQLVTSIASGVSRKIPESQQHDVLAFAVLDLASRENVKVVRIINRTAARGKKADGSMPSCVTQVGRAPLLDSEAFPFADAYESIVFISPSLSRICVSVFSKTMRPTLFEPRSSAVTVRKPFPNACTNGKIKFNLPLAASIRACSISPVLLLCATLLEFDPPKRIDEASSSGPIGLPARGWECRPKPTNGKNIEADKAPPGKTRCLPANSTGVMRRGAQEYFLERVIRSDFRRAADAQGFHASL